MSNAMARLMRVGALILAAGLVFALTDGVSTAETRASTPAPPVGDFYQQLRWDQDQAEINLYDAVEVRYGVARQATEAALIFVKEDHRAEDYVKADDPARGDLPAIKLNWSVVVPTGIYTYRQMASVFVDRQSALPFRESFTSQEWCGNTVKDLRLIRTAQANSFRYRYWSYFGNEGEGERTVAIDSVDTAVFADALPVYLRALDLPAIAESGRTYTISVVPTLIANRAQPDRVAAPLAVAVSVARLEDVTVPAGRFNVWRITVEYTSSDGTKQRELYDYDDGPDRRLIGMQRADGAVYKLRKSMWLDYWRHHDVGDERLREGAGIE